MRKTIIAFAATALMLGGCGSLTGDKGASADEGSTTAASTGDTAEADAPKAAASSLDPLLADPQVGDIWAADLNHFSSVDFSDDNGTQSESFGQVKVVEVSPDRVTIITEDAAWPNAEGARRELRDRSAIIRWDESERIPVNRADFAALVADGKILETRR